MDPDSMQSRGIRTRRMATQLGACLVVVANATCSAPDLKPNATAQLPPVAEIPPLVIPADAYCGPKTIPTAPSAELGSAVSESCNGDAPSNGDLAHTPVMPLGIGYPDVDNPLPSHMAYLTFDDGPSEWTNTFLDILKAKGVLATFFVTAKQLKGPLGLDATYVDTSGATVVFRDVLKRILAEGHAIGNHTVNHPDIGRITRSQITAELDQNELLVNRALVRAGAKPQVLSLFRPPYGSPWFTGIAGKAPPEASDRISSHALNIMWTVTSGDSSDWALGESYSLTADPVREPNPPTYEAKMQRVLNDVLSKASGDGVIILMHDTHSATRDVLAEIIDGYAAQGYSFDTIEHYVEWRWNRPSIDLTPGPRLYDHCVPERDWGCASMGAPGEDDRAHEVCGRMWLAYTALGGPEALGNPIAAPTQAEDTGIVSQQFELGRVELHPENPAPCNMIAFPQ